MRLAKMPNGNPEIYSAVQGEGLTMGKPMTFVRLSGCNLHCIWCWGANTLILMADGTHKKIQDVKVGDFVMSYNKGSYTISKVLNHVKRYVDNYVNVYCDGTVTSVTPEHRYYVNHHKGGIGKFKGAKYLQPAGKLEGRYLKQTYYWKSKNYVETPDFRKGYFKGALLGDGCMLQQGKYIRLWFQVCDKDFIEKIQDIGNNDFGKNGSITISNRRTKKNKVVYRYSVSATDIASDLLELPHDNLEEVRGFISGFFDAEGHVARNQIVLAQKDIKVLERIQKMLLAFDFKSKLSVQKSGMGILIINGRDNVYEFLNVFSPSILRKVKSFTENNSKQLTSKLVDKVEVCNENLAVYNITTTIGNCFANGFLATQCDTFYTWNFEGTKFDNEHLTAPKVKMSDYQMIMEPKEVAEYIMKVSKGHKNVVFTGGEPLIQQIEIQHVMRLLGSEWYAEVETNGTMVLADDTALYLNQINCSPKLASSGNSKILRHNPKAIQSLIKAGMEDVRGLCFKFVIKKETLEDDLKEVENWIHDIVMSYDENSTGLSNAFIANSVEKLKSFIYLMPEGTNPVRIIEGMKVLNEIAQEKGYKVTPRLQILTYGEKRAV